MKTFATPLMFAAALAGAAAPALAAPVSTPLTTFDATRAATPVEEESDLAGIGNNRKYVFGIIGVIIILAVILIVRNDTPTSP